MHKLMINTALSTAALAMPRAFANDPAAGTATPRSNAPRVEPQLTAVASITMPTRSSKRGSVSIYPFANLTTVGQAFGVKNKTAAQLSSIVSNANRKALVPVTDENGPVYDTKEISGADGTKTVVPDTSKPKMTASKHFFAFDVTAEYKKANAEAFKKDGPFEGATALVFRDA